MLDRFCSVGCVWDCLGTFKQTDESSLQFFEVLRESVDTIANSAFSCHKHDGRIDHATTFQRRQNLFEPQISRIEMLNILTDMVRIINAKKPNVLFSEMLLLEMISAFVPLFRSGFE